MRDCFICILNKKIKMTTEQFSKRIREIRHTMNLSQHEFAVACGASPITIVTLESGKLKNVTLSTMSRIADGLQISLSELLADECPTVPQNDPWINKVTAFMQSLPDSGRKRVYDLVHSTIVLDDERQAT